MNENNQQNQINIDPYIQNEMGRLNYQAVLYKAQLDHVLQINQELQQKIQELENKQSEPKK